MRHRHVMVSSDLAISYRVFRSQAIFPLNRPLSRGGHFESQGNKKLCFCPSSLALNERLDGHNLLFQHGVIKFYWVSEKFELSLKLGRSQEKVGVLYLERSGYYLVE